MSPIFDDSRWDRFRRWGYNWHHNFREDKEVGFRLFWQVSLWAVPLPSISFYWEACEIEISIGIGTRGMSDDLVNFGFGFSMSPRVADWLYATCKRLRLVK